MARIRLARLDQGAWPPGPWLEDWAGHGWARARLTQTLSQCQAQWGQTLPLSVHSLMGERRAPGCPAGLQPARVLLQASGKAQD